MILLVRSILLLFTTILLSLFSLASQAQYLNFGLNDDSVSADYLGQTYRGDFWAHAGVYHHEELGQNFHLGFLMSEPEWSLGHDFWVGVGGEAVYLDAEGPDGAAIAVGGIASATIVPSMRIKVQASGFYAPSVIAFSGLDKYYKVSARLVMDVLSTVSVYAGYRRIHAGFEFIRDRDLDDSVHVGAILQF